MDDISRPIVRPGVQLARYLKRWTDSGDQNIDVKGSGEDGLLGSIRKRKGRTKSLLNSLLGHQIGHPTHTASLLPPFFSLNALHRINNPFRLFLIDGEIMQSYGSVH